MKFQDFLREATKLHGEPGYEEGVSPFIAEQFRALGCEVRIGALGSVVAKMGSAGPKVMISAHMDEIGLLVMKVEDDGSIRLTANGGVDPRILPAMEVTVDTKNGPVFGVVGAKPPHLLSAADQGKPPQIKDMYVDIGFSPDEVKAMVEVGDQVYMNSPLTNLQGDYLAGKTFDDRACVGAMLLAAERIKRMNVRAQVYFVASVQEEIGAAGAYTEAYAINPDFAIAIDVNHANQPGADKFDAVEPDKLTITRGPRLHRKLTERLEKVAKDNGVPFSIEVAPNGTGTDADEITIRRDGVPTTLISYPLRYMHTSVEVIKESVATDMARLISLFIDDMAGGWEEFKWY